MYENIFVLPVIIYSRNCFTIYNKFCNIIMIFLLSDKNFAENLLVIILFYLCSLFRVMYVLNNGPGKQTVQCLTVTVIGSLKQGLQKI